MLDTEPAGTLAPTRWQGLSRVVPGASRLVAIAAALIVLIGVIGGWAASSGGHGALLSDRASVAAPTQLPIPGQAVNAFRGLGTWASIYDYAPTYQSGDSLPAVTPADVATMASAGVRTLYLQTAGTDARSAGGFADPALVGQFLTEAHRWGLRVVGWYAPTFADPSTALQRLSAAAEYRAQGQRFDGLALDIENTTAVVDPSQRTQQLLSISTQLRQMVGPAYPLGAIVIPPVLLDVINPALWPGFPWHALSQDYNAWLPMAYWTFRSAQSGYRDPERYAAENVTRLRDDVGDPATPVHVVGGVSDAVASADEYRAFLAGAAQNQAIGASIFSYRFLSAADLAILRDGTPPAGFDQQQGNLHE